MKLQLAVDRMPVSQTLQLLDQLTPYLDILEMGTSYTKEYGVAFLKALHSRYSKTKILADLKIMDEAAYECELYYGAGAQIVTVMGAAALSTIQITQACAKRWNRQYCIDLLEVKKMKLSALSKFHDAIFCIHLPKDSEGNLITLIQEQKKLLPDGVQIAAAGGIGYEQLPALHAAGVDIVIIGSAITGHKEPLRQIQKYRKWVNKA